jgi:hypothetical protein
MPNTLDQMATPKTQDKHKPNRMVRIPEAMALALEQLADEQFNSLTEQVKIAVREYLERHQRMPKPPHPHRPKS